MILPTVMCRVWVSVCLTSDPFYNGQSTPPVPPDVPFVLQQYRAYENPRKTHLPAETHYSYRHYCCNNKLHAFTPAVYAWRPLLLYYDTPAVLLYKKCKMTYASVKRSWHLGTTVARIFVFSAKPATTIRVTNNPPPLKALTYCNRSNGVGTIPIHATLSRFPI